MKNYDLRLEGPGLANVGHIIGTGHLAARGINVPEKELVAKTKSEVPSLPPGPPMMPVPESTLTGDGVGVAGGSASCSSSDVGGFISSRHQDQGDLAAETENCDFNIFPVENEYEYHERSEEEDEYVEVPIKKRKLPEKKVMEKTKMLPAAETEEVQANEEKFSSMAAAAGNFGREVAKSIMEGADKMFQSFMATRTEYTTRYVVQRGDCVQKVEVSLYCVLHLISIDFNFSQMSSRPSQE